MGSQFFKGKGQQQPISGGNPGLEARAIGSAVYGSRGAAVGAQKDLGKADAIAKAGLKPLKRTAAFAKGPKI